MNYSPGKAMQIVSQNNIVIRFDLCSVRGVAIFILLRTFKE